MPITPQEALLRCIEHREIFHDEMLHLFRQIMSGEMSPTMVAALTMGLRVKKETIGEITAAAQVMREFSTKVPMADTTNLLDIVGTGGDGANTFNISSASMFVAAAAGARVAKHGGRSVSSSSGSADLIESLGAGTLVGELVNGEIREYEIHPEDFGLSMISSRNLKVANTAESKTRVMEALRGEPGPAHDIVALNAGTALYAAGVVASIDEGLAKARATIASGAALAKLEQFVNVTRQLGAKG